MKVARIATALLLAVSLAATAAAQGQDTDAVLAGLVLLELDAQLGSDSRPFLFPGGPDGARAVLGGGPTAERSVSTGRRLHVDGRHPTAGTRQDADSRFRREVVELTPLGRWGTEYPRSGDCVNLYSTRHGRVDVADPTRR